MRRPLVIANWKANPASVKEAVLLARKIERGTAKTRGVEVVIAPPFPYLLLAARRRIILGAQDVFWEAGGAYTGEVSPSMLRDLGVRYVILGHSERRRHIGESDEAVNLKIKAALKAGLVPVIAIGEESKDSQEVVPPILFQQLSRAIAGIPKRRLRDAVIAYEPVWAISTTPGSRHDTPDHATRRAIYIRKLLTKMVGSRVADTTRIIYGGSVNAQNAASFLSRDIRGMEGLLVGAASLQADEFIKIVASVAQRS